MSCDMGKLIVSNVGKAYKKYSGKWARVIEWITGVERHQKKWVLDDINFLVNPGEAVGIIGVNGAGKSTLLKIIAGVRTATRGSVSAPKDCVIAYLPQHLMTEDGRTVFEETCQAFAHLHEMQAEIDRR